MTVRFCARCVVSNMRPIASLEYAREIGSEPDMMRFSRSGVCGACLVAERKAQTDWKAKNEELYDKLGEYRRKDDYDVIVPGSGGKDSVLAAWLLKHKFGMHPLCVTWAPHEYTDVGLRNLRAW